MARTPLFRVVTRALRLAQHSLHDERPAAELTEAACAQLERARVTRREFVAGASAVAGIALLDACAPARVRPPAPERDVDPVIVVGAGIAGLTAAYRLRQAGVPVALYEAQDRIGGRMWSLRNHFADGQVAELGGELIDTGHATIRALARELGIALDDLAADDPALATDVWFFGGRRRTEAEVVEAFRPVAARIERDLATLRGDDVSYVTPAGAESLDRMSLAEWLDGAGVSGWFRSLLDVAYTTEYGMEPGEQSALNLLLLIDPTPQPFRVFGESDERFHTHDGNDAIPLELGRRLGDVVRTGTMLEAVRGRADGRYECAFRRGGSSLTRVASHVLLAIPFTLLRDVRLDVPLPPVKRRAIAELGYGANAKLMVGVGERVWRTRHGSNGSTLSDLPYQLCWETSRGQGGRSGIVTNFTGGRHAHSLASGTAAEQAARLTADLERVFHGFAAARGGMKEARMNWPSFPWARGSYAGYKVGQWTGIAGAEGEAVDRLYFAGEHCSRAAQGFMEGGCETGERAAKEILRSVGVPLRKVGAAPRRLLAVA